MLPINLFQSNLISQNRRSYFIRIPIYEALLNLNSKGLNRSGSQIILEYHRIISQSPGLIV